MKSNKAKDINYRDAVMDPETRKVFIQSKSAGYSEEYHLICL